MDEIIYRKLLENAPFGYAYHKIILNENEEPIDYTFLETNQAFKELTGLSSDIINKKVTEIIPNIKNDKFNWIKFYGNIALNGGKEEFEQYSTPFKRWYKVQVYSNEKYYFITLFIDITKEKANLEELEEFFSVNLDLLCIADIEGNFIKTNKAWEDILGYTTEELNRRKFLEFVHPEDIPSTLEALSKLGNQEKVLNFINRYCCQDGSYRFIEWHSHPKDNLIYAAARDITGHLEVIEALRDSEEKYKILVENANDIIYSLTIDGEFKYVSPVWKKLLGHEQKEVEGKIFSIFVHPEDIPICLSFLQKIIETRTNQGGVEYRVLHKNGEWRYHTTNGAPVLDANGNFDYFIGVARDITEKKKTEQLLKESEEKNRLLSQVTMEGIIIHNNGIAIDVNDAIIKLTGFEKNEIIGNNIILKSIHPDDISIVFKNMEQEHTTPYVVRLVRKDGSIGFIEIEAYNLVWQNQELRVASVRDVTEKKKIADELKANELQFERIIENLPISLSIISIDGTPLYFNSKCIELFEIENDDFQKIISITELWYNPNDRSIWLNELKEKGIVKDFEMNMLTKKGNKFWALGSGIIINYKNQNCVLSTHIDISRRKIAEEELSIERNQLLSIFDSIDELIYVSDTDTFDIVFANKKLRNLYGDDIIGKKCFNVIQGKNESCSFCTTKYIRNIYPEPFKWEYTNHLNRTYVVYDRMIKWTDGRFLRFEMAFDITDRKKAEEALRESEEKLKAIYNATNIGILITNREGRYVMVNNWILNRLNYSKDELLNKTNCDITHQEDLEITKSYFNQILNGEIEYYRIDKRFLKSDNTVVWGNLSVAPIKDIDGKIVNLVGMVIDITEQKFAEVELKRYAAELSKINEELVASKQLIEASLEQKNALIEELNDIKNKLEQSNSEKDKFFSIIAHDLRSPFQGFIGLTKLLAEDLDSMSMKDMRELSSSMQDSANNLFKLLDNLLQWSRLQRGVMEFKTDAISIHQIAQQNINISLETAKQKNISLINDVPADIYAIADYQMINTVVRNLLSNAIKFTNKNGNIIIGANKTPDKIIFVFVKDDGIGMDKQILNDLFKIDKKVARPGTSGEKSTGLGLLLCKDFIEKNNGSIWAESKVNQGSTFFFTLPQNVTENFDFSIFENL